MSLIDVRARADGRSRAVAVCATIILVAATLNACERTRSSPDAARLFSSPALHRVNIGLREEERRDATLGMITVARLAEAGRHVVVLDFVAPYVKVFDSRGRFERSFLRTGAGPGEARFPVSLAVSGDTAIFVADATGRMMTFGMDGQLRAEATEPRLQALAATAGCSGAWLIYGPRFPAGVGPQARAPTWLHRVVIGREGLFDVQDALPDSVASDIIPNGVAYGLTSDPGGAMVWHTLGRENLLAAWRCGEPEPRVLARRTPVERPDPGTPVEGGVRFQIGPGARTRGGIAAVPGGVIIAEGVMGKRVGTSTTELTLLRDDGTRRIVSVPGAYVIRDSRPGVGVLVSSTDPVPQVFLVSEADLLALFAPG